MTPTEVMAAARAELPEVEQLEANVLVIRRAFSWGPDLAQLADGLDGWSPTPMGTLLGVAGREELAPHERLFVPVVGMVLREYLRLNPHAARSAWRELGDDLTYRIGRWRTGEGWAPHGGPGPLVKAADGTIRGQVLLNVFAFLTDECLGGELHLPRQKLRIAPEAGTVTAFPAGFTHPHEGIPTRRGSRHLLLTGLW